MRNVTLDDLLSIDNMSVIYETSGTLNFDVNPTNRRVTLYGVVNADGSVNHELAGRMLEAIRFLYNKMQFRSNARGNASTNSETTADVATSNVKMTTRTIFNFKGEPSGEELIDQSTGKVVDGYGYINGDRYRIVPMGHPEDKEPSWMGDTITKRLTVMNSFTPEYVQFAVAEAQMAYARRD